MSKRKWPLTVPVLAAEDFCRHTFNLDNGTRCLVGWVNYVFSYAVRGVRQSYVVRQQVFDALDSETKGDPIGFNDSRRPKVLLARAWNRAMARLGYVVGNPEAKAVKH